MFVKKVTKMFQHNDFDMLVVELSSRKKNKKTQNCMPKILSTMSITARWSIDPSTQCQRNNTITPLVLILAFYALEDENNCIIAWTLIVTIKSYFLAQRNDLSIRRSRRSSKVRRILSKTGSWKNTLLFPIYALFTLANLSADKSARQKCRSKHAN